MKRSQKLSKVSMLLVAIFMLASSSLLAQNAGIFQTYIVYDLDGAGNAFRAGGINSDLSPEYDGIALGTPTSLTLNGGEVKSYKNSGGDVLGAEIFYNVHLQTDPVGSFSQINLPFNSDLGGGDQKWQEEFAGVDVLTGLAPGNYYLEVFWRIRTNISVDGDGDGGIDGFIYDSDFGSNFRGSFTVAGAPAIPTLGQWGLIVLCLSFLCMGTVILFKSKKKTALA